MAQSSGEPRKTTPNRLVDLVGRGASRVARAIEDVRARSALRSELAQLAAIGQLDCVMSDLGIASAEVSTLVENHPGSARRLATMLRRLRIEVVPGAGGSVDVHAIQRTCLLCAASGHCEHWSRSEGSEDPRQFCPNSDAFVELVKSGKARYRRGV